MCVCCGVVTMSFEFLLFCCREKSVYFNNCAAQGRHAQPSTANGEDGGGWSRGLAWDEHTAAFRKGADFSGHVSGCSRTLPVGSGVGRLAESTGRGEKGETVTVVATQWGL